MNSLNKIAEEYLKQNGISVKHFAECIGAGYTTVVRWLDGTRNLNVGQIKRVHKFLNGEYVKTVKEIMEEKK